MGVGAGVDVAVLEGADATMTTGKAGFGAAAASVTDEPSVTMRSGDVASEGHTTSAMTVEIAAAYAAALVPLLPSADVTTGDAAAAAAAIERMTL